MDNMAMIMIMIMCMCVGNHRYLLTYCWMLLITMSFLEKFTEKLRFVLRVRWPCVRCQVNVSYHVHVHVKGIHVVVVRRYNYYLLQGFFLIASRRAFHFLPFCTLIVYRDMMFNVLCVDVFIFMYGSLGGYCDRKIKMDQVV